MRWMASGLLLTSLALAGCEMLPVLKSDDGPKPTALVTETLAPPPTVTPDQITDQNASEMLNRLRDELDYSAGEREVPPPKPNEKKR